MKKALILAAAAAALTLSSCGLYFPHVTGSDNIITVIAPAVDFSRVVVDSQFEATVGYGEAYSVEITANDNLMSDYIGIFQDGDTVKITLDPSCWYTDITLKARITLPVLNEVTAEGNSSVTVFSSPALFPENFAMNAGGNAKLDVTVPSSFSRDVTITADGNGAVDFAGTVDTLSVVGSDNAKITQTGGLESAVVTGSGNMEIELEASYIHDVGITLSDNSKVHVDTVGVLYGSLEDNARVLYSGSISTRNLSESDNADVEWELDLGL